MSKQILIHPECLEHIKNQYNGCHCAYIRDNALDTFKCLFQRGVNNFSYFSINDNVEQLFRNVAELSTRKICFTIWCDIYSKYTLDYINYIINNKDTKKSKDLCIKTLGIYIPYCFFKELLNENKLKLFDNCETVVLKHGTEYENAIKLTECDHVIDASKALSLILFASICSDTKILLYSRDCTYAVCSDGQQEYSADIKEGLVFPNHLGEVPMHITNTTIQYAAYVNVAGTQNIQRMCNEAYDMLLNIISEKDSSEYNIVAVVGLVGYADKFKDNIVTPKDIERLAAPLIKNSFNVFPMAGSYLCAKHGISEGIWSSINPIRFSSNNDVVLSNDFVKYIESNDELNYLVLTCNKDGYCLIKVPDESRQHLIDMSTNYIKQKQSCLEKVFLATPLEMQQDTIQIIQHSFFTTVAMPLYILPKDFRYFHCNESLVECLHKIVIRNASKMCPILLPEIRSSESVLNEARNRRINCRKIFRKMPCYSLKRKHLNTDFCESFISSSQDFLNGVKCALLELNDQNPVTAFALKFIENIVENKNETTHT